MSFIADQQTLEDLNLLGKYKPDSIFSIYNQVKTSGGEKLLESMFQNPLANESDINKRRAYFSFFQQRALSFPFAVGELEVMENYLSDSGDKTILTAAVGNFKNKIMELVAMDKRYEMTRNGIMATAVILRLSYDFLNNLTNLGVDHPFIAEVLIVMTIFTDHHIWSFINEKSADDFSLGKISKLDFLLRSRVYEKLKVLLEFIYSLDVYISVSNLAELRGFSYAHAVPGERHKIHIKGMHHPRFENAVSNEISVKMKHNVVFLTGANMAGKSTLMKTFGVAVYMAHMGFPIAVKEMQFSVMDGIYSSINVPDNLRLGYSHFYAEVLRVKKVAQEVSSGKSFVVIFDELFKGTNVKDAYDATLAVTVAFSENNTCFFIISTHIIEVGEKLMEQSKNIKFVYLPTVMDGNMPKYTYQLEQGITKDRQGMMIIENERILEILQGNIIAI